MCTLVLARGVFPGHPLGGAANRDELLARPAAGPSRWDEGPIPFVAPKDLQAGGTWLGLSAAGLFCAVTNRRLPAVDGRERLTRGRLVIDALAEPTAARAAARISAQSGARYDGFHLVVADRERALLVWGDGESLRSHEIGMGLSIVTQLGFEGEGARHAAILERAAGVREATVDALRPLLTIHAPSPLDGTCIHADEVGYGTRSSAIVRVDAEGRASLAWCEGHPCTGTFGAQTPVASLGGP